MISHSLIQQLLVLLYMKQLKDKHCICSYRKIINLLVVTVDQSTSCHPVIHSFLTLYI